MKRESLARLLVVVLALGLGVAALLARSLGARRAIEIHGRMAETGGWTPGELTARVGEPLHLRLASDDVMHGFAIGQSDRPAIDMKPGEVSETVVSFDRPGKYTFYCTRWCGPNHWRMRGTIEVRGAADPRAAKSVPAYVRLGLDLDAPHPAAVVPDRRPSSARGAALEGVAPRLHLTPDAARAISPARLWDTLKRDVDPSRSARLSGADLWDLVALHVRSATTPAALAEGRRLYAANCAACHGETGGGSGVMAASVAAMAPSGGHQPGGKHGPQKPADFTDRTRMLGASPALLHGKIVRGGMGTGMPYWGPIFTDEQIWSIVSYLYTFQFDQ